MFWQRHINGLENGFCIGFFGLTYIKKLGEYFMLVDIENPYCNRVHFFEPLILATDNAKATGFHLVN